MSWLFNWISANATLFAWVSTASFFLLCLTVFTTPWLVAQLPQDYFLSKAASSLTTNKPAGEFTAVSLCRGIIKFARNVLGVSIIGLGLILMLTPGPGLVTLVLGFSLCEFSCKQRLLGQWINHPTVFLALNWMRLRHGKPAFLPIPQTPEPPA